MIILYKNKDFIFMDVENVKGKKIGIIKDILLDLKKNKIEGFSISTYSVFKKKLQITIPDVIAFNDTMIANKVSLEKGIKFSDIKGMDVVDESYNIIGTVEDILFEEETFKIRGVILSGGFLKNIFNGKRVVLIKDILVGEESIMYVTGSRKIQLFSVIHKIDDARLYL